MDGFSIRLPPNKSSDAAIKSAIYTMYLQQQSKQYKGIGGKKKHLDQRSLQIPKGELEGAAECEDAVSRLAYLMGMQTQHVTLPKLQRG